MKNKHSRIHLVLTLVWVGLVLPTILWWHSSILWVLLVSLWANIVSHWGAWEASRAKELAEVAKEKP